MFNRKKNIFRKKKGSEDFVVVALNLLLQLGTTPGAKWTKIKSGRTHVEQQQQQQKQMKHKSRTIPNDRFANHQPIWTIFINPYHGTLKMDKSLVNRRLFILPIQFCE